MMQEAGAPEEHLKELWREAAIAFKAPLESSFMGEAEPMLEFMRLSLRRRHPGISESLVREIFSDVAVLSEIAESVRELNSVETDVKN
jgi:hypothetical protein